jgi:predicted Fe-S protein YdhL (DUF1289 family)
MAWRAMMRLPFTGIPLGQRVLAGIHITDIESAINYWRSRMPATDSMALPAPTRALAEVYARMVYDRVETVEEASLTDEGRAAWLQWYASTPDTPCIAICSTSQGDECCKGCGRTFVEVQHWPAMGAVEKRAIWRRITLEGSAWRFNKYAERAAESK